MSEERRRRRRWPWVVALALVLMTGLSLWQGLRAAEQARTGKTALQAASAAVEARDLDTAERHLTEASAAFTDVRSALRWAGPPVWVARYVPVVRQQVRAVDTFAAAGAAVSTSGLELLPSVGELVEKRQAASSADTLLALGANREGVAAAVRRLDRADQRVRDLAGQALLPPLASTRDALAPELAEAADLARTTETGLALLTDLAGVESPRRYLFLSQNPEEPRPTGGYIGTYGVIEGKAGKAELVRYGAMGDWYAAHPGVEVPPAQAPYPFRFAVPPVGQSLGDVNTTPHWPAAAEQAVALWTQAGEPAVDGVLTLRPDLLARLLEVLGPVTVPGYAQPFAAATLAKQLDFYTHGDGVRGTTLAERKQPVGDLAQVVLARTVNAPGEQLPDLAAAFAAGLDAGEAAVWSTRDDLQGLLAREGWDGAFEGADGDFFADAEFAYSSKNGSLLQRTFRHTVQLEQDGAGTTSTELTVRNTGAYDFLYNKDSNAYLTPYGPRGGELVEALDDVVNAEPALQGHPTAGFLLSAPPRGSASLTVGWKAPALALERTDGRFEYRLTWLPTPGHVGDVLELAVRLPPGWSWQAEPPPTRVALDGPFQGRWVLEPGSGT